MQFAMRCIYCLQDKETEEFNREHVVSQVFGGFDNNLVLHQIVRLEYNSFLAMWSIELYHAANWGLLSLIDLNSNPQIVLMSFHTKRPSFGTLTKVFALASWS